MPSQEKKQKVERLNAKLASAQSIQIFPANIDLVTKYYDQLKAARRQKQ